MPNFSLLFLDIDGVLNCLATAIAFSQGYQDKYWSPVAVNLMQSLCKRTNASIVITSSKRKDYDSDKDCIEAFKDILKHYGWIDAPIIGRTGCAGHCTNELTGKIETRGVEINEWLKKYGSTVYHTNNWIIIDDDSDFMPHQIERFVKTTFCNGFDYVSYVQALNLLGCVDKHLNVHAESTLNHYRNFKI